MKVNKEAVDNEVPDDTMHQITGSSFCRLMFTRNLLFHYYFYGPIFSFFFFFFFFFFLKTVCLHLTQPFKQI